MNGGEIVAIMAISGSVITGLVQAIFHGTSLSRCKTIACCCMRCEREVIQDESIYLNDNNNNNNNNNNNDVITSQ